MHTGVEKVRQRRSRIAWGHWAFTNSRPSANVKRFGHCRLTDSPARTNVVLFIHRTVRLIILRVADVAAALFGKMRVSARWGGRVRTKAFLTTLRPC